MKIWFQSLCFHIQLAPLRRGQVLDGAANEADEFPRGGVGLPRGHRGKPREGWGPGAAELVHGGGVVYKLNAAVTQSSKAAWFGDSTLAP